MASDAAPAESKLETEETVLDGSVLRPAPTEPEDKVVDRDAEEDAADDDGCSANDDAPSEAAETTTPRRNKAEKKRERREKQALRWKEDKKRRKTGRKRRPLGGQAGADGGGCNDDASNSEDAPRGHQLDSSITSSHARPAADWAAGMDVEEKKRHRALRKEAELNDFNARVAQGTTIVLDLEWEAELEERELKALVQQVLYSYGSHRSATRPIRLVLSGVAPGSDTCRRLQKLAGFPSAWAGVEVLPVPYIQHYASETERRRLVYLTADTEEVISKFDTDKVYIIGGIVDHNRLKGRTKKKADEQGIASARLPLQEHIQMGASRKVLTVNHVVEIVLEHQRCGDWQATFEKCVPGRKQFVDNPAEVEDAPAADSSRASEPASIKEDPAPTSHGADEAASGI